MRFLLEKWIHDAKNKRSFIWIAFVVAIIFLLLIGLWIFKGREKTPETLNLPVEEVDRLVNQVDKNVKPVILTPEEINKLMNAR